MRRAAWVIFVALAAWAAPRNGGVGPSTNKDVNVVLRVCPGGCGPTADTGTFGSANLCDYANANGMLTGNYVCMRGDGSNITGGSGMSIAKFGSPVTQVSRDCSNGPNCAAITGQRVSNTNIWRAASATNPAADFSACVLYEVDALGSSGQSAMGQWSGSSASDGWYFQHTSSTNDQFCIVTNGSDSINCNQSATPSTNGAKHFICGTLHAAGAGSSRQTLYRDGVQLVQQTNASPIFNAGVAHSLSIGEIGAAPGTEEPLAGRVFGAFRTDVELTSTQVANLANLVLGPGGPQGLAGASGEAITTTRASISTCTDDQGDVSILPSGRPCLGAGGVGTYLSIQNVAQFYNSIGVSPWTAHSATVGSAILDPAGAMLGTPVVDNSTVTPHYWAQSVTLTVATWYFSAYAKPGTLNFVALGYGASDATFNVSTCAAGTGGHGSLTQGQTLLGNGWCRIWISFTGVASPTNVYVGVGDTGPDAAPNGTGYAGTGSNAVVTFTQAETPGVSGGPGRICPTVGASATCNADQIRMSAATPALGLQFCTSMDAAAQWGSTETDLIGTSPDTIANTWSLAQQSNQLGWTVMDNSNNNKHWFPANTLTAGTSHHFRTCYDGTTGNAPLMWVDGVPLSVGASGGTGTGILANQNAAIWIAGIGDGNASQLEGVATNICVGNCPGGITACSVCP